MNANSMFDVVVNGSQIGMPQGFDMHQNGSKSATGKDSHDKGLHHHQRTQASHFATQDARQ